LQEQSQKDNLPEDVPYGYIKAYNPILLVTSLIAIVLTLLTTIFCIIWYLDPTISDRMLVLILTIISFAQLNVTIGLWYLTYKYARISEEPLTKLKRIAVMAESVIEYGEILIAVGRPWFNWLKEMYEKGKIRPMTKEDIKHQIETLQKKLREIP